MDSTRRNFLKSAGVAAVGLSVKPAAANAGLADAAYEFIFGPKGAAPFDEKLSAKKWAMVVDTRKCTHESMEKMIHACHHVHNVPSHPLRKKGDKYSKNEIKWLWEEHFHNAFTDLSSEHLPPEVLRKEVLLMCNHCTEAPCVRVCPTKSTFKRDDGIVLMDFHRCIGCRFCMAACPYGSRSFNFVEPKLGLEEEFPGFPRRTKGVVEKCNFCAERLARGEMPACVEACEDNELIFGDISDPESEVSKALRQNYTIQRKPSLGTQPQVYYIV